MQSPLQSLFIQPREGKDPRVAAVDHSAFGVGSDGKLYKILDHKEWGKYRTTTEQEESDELLKSKEIKENIYMLSGKTNNGRYSSSRGSGGVKVVAPQFGTQSRTRKLERREWDREMDCLVTHGVVVGKSRYHDTMTALVENQRRSTPRSVSLSQPTELPTSFCPANGGLRASQDSEERIAAAVRTMKDKYEQNLHVVEQLFDEKRVMERKLQLLEERLRRRAAGGESDAAEVGEHHGDFQEASIKDEDTDALRDQRDSLRDPLLSSYDPADYPRTTEGRYSAVELANVLDGAGDKAQSRPPAPPRPLSAPARRPAPPRSTYSPQRGREVGVSQSVRASRSLSAGSRRSTSSSVNISANLQADADRYVQKRRMWEEQERQRRLDDERHEQRLRERYLKASMNGKEFTEMRKRQELAEQQSKARLERFLQKQEETEEALRRERKAKAMANRASLAQVTKNQLTWRELQEMEEAKRRDRIERRKQELAQSSALPSSIAESLQKPRRESIPTGSGAGVTEFKAEDPAKVAAKLAHAQKVWELRMEREKERIREKSGRQLRQSTGSLAGSGGSLGKSSMELRNEQYAARREARALEKREKEEAEARRLREEEEKRKQRLLNQKVPIGKPTNSAIMKAEKVRNDRLREEAEERRVRAQLRQKEISEKEAAAVLKVIIAEREAERRGGSGAGSGQYELRKSAGLAAAERKAAEAVAAAREQYREQLRANKKRIADSLANRKSLIERHDATLAMKTASQEALQKVAVAVGVTSGKEEAGDNFDLFDAKEQVRLGLKTL